MNNVNVYDASDDAYIVFLAFFAFVDVYIEYSLRRCAQNIATFLTSLGLFFLAEKPSLGFEGCY